MRWVVALLVCVALAVSAVFVAAPPARACSIAETFTVTLEHLSEDDFNDADSRLARDYREWHGDPDATIEIRGVYVYETIYSVEPTDDWSRGSVSVPVQMWGEWPDDPTPRAIEPQDRSGEPPDDCGWGPTGTTVGTRRYTIIADVDGVGLSTDGTDPDGVLTAAFGAPAIAERDAALEEELIARIEASRNRSSGLLVGVGIAALAVAAVVFYMTRRTARSGDEIEALPESGES